MNNDTPETDAAIYPMSQVDVVWPDFARRLEHERNQARDSAIKNAEMAGDLASDLQRLRSAVRNLRDAKGRHHTQIAMELLMSLLPENSNARPPA